MPRTWETQDLAVADGGHLTIDGVDAVDLAAEFGTPLFVFSERRIRHNVARLLAVGDSIPFEIKVCYAAKAMSTLGILRAVRAAGSDVEVNSGGELWKVLEAGFTGTQIIFNGTAKEIWEIELAIENDIYAIQVDSAYELSLIEETAKRLGRKARVSLRLVPEIESATHSGLQTALLTSKFGMMPTEAFATFGEYKDSPHLAMNGIHLHIGSQNPDPAVYTAALEELFAGVVRIFEETGIALEHVNIGGGFPVDYLGDTRLTDPLSDERVAMLSANFDPYAALAAAWEAVSSKEWVKGHAPLFRELTILFEPGRSIIGDAGICLTSVRNTKSRPVRNAAAAVEDHWLLTDAGFNILLSMETYKWYYHLISATRAAEDHLTAYKVAGPLCDGGDVYFDIEGEGRLPDHRLLPAGTRAGDVLALLNCGAYSLAQASQYNARFLPPVVLIDLDGKPVLIRRRDNFADLVAADL